MATITERFGFTKPAGSDPASVVPLNSNTDLIEQYLGRTQDMIAPLYDDTDTYEVDDIVTYESRLYKCITAISTAETFDPTKWEATTAVEEGSGGGGGSSVIPNPTGTPTDTLSTVSIDGTIYGIEGGGSISGEGVEIYSESEYIVGKWIDGKKLYQRTVHLSNIEIPSGTTTIKYTDDSIEYAWVEKGIFREGRTDAVIPSIITNLTFDQSNSARFGVGIDDVNRNYIKFFSSDNFSANVDRHLYITIRYTKTVETPAPAWGGSVTNNYASFIDTDNVIQTFTQISDTSEHTYTATQDCIIVYYVASQGDTFIKINNVLVGGNHSQNIFALCDYVAVKKGQTFSFQQSYAGSSNSGYTVYGITYASGGSSSGSSVEYSTEEKEVGTWIDGSKIYQKTMVLTNLSLQQGSNNFELSTFNISDVQYVIEQPKGFLKVNASDIRTYPFGSAYSISTYATPTKLVIERTGNNLSLAELIITIRYTKVVS